jgi:hypothetical protein
MGESETKEQARNRFLTNYLSLVVEPDMDWFDEAVKPLLKIAIQDPGSARPWHTSITPVLVATQAPRRQSVLGKLLTASLAKLGGVKEPQPRLDRSEFLPWGPLPVADDLVEALIV